MVEYLAGNRIRGTNAERIALISYPDISGGTENTYSSAGVNYKSHTFLSTGSLVVTDATDIDILIIGGGGTGGNAQSSNGGAGGGAGGYGVKTGHTLSTGSKSVTINGAGNTTVFESITASSGGTGGNGFTSGGNSGTATGNSVTQYQNAGGSSRGSGGGAGSAGTSGSNSQGAAGTSGGNGLANSFRTGSDEYRGGGGSSGSNKNSYASAAGVHGGGAGGARYQSGTAGTVNTGGGGGAGGFNGQGAAGGSGILIIRYVGTYNVEDGSIFYETDTNKEYILSSGTWTEL